MPITLEDIMYCFDRETVYVIRSGDEETDVKKDIVDLPLALCECIDVIGIKRCGINRIKITLDADDYSKVMSLYEIDDIESTYEKGSQELQERICKISGVSNRYVPFSEIREHLANEPDADIIENDIRNAIAIVRAHELPELSWRMSE